MINFHLSFLPSSLEPGKPICTLFLQPGQSLVLFAFFCSICDYHADNTFYSIHREYMSDIDYIDIWNVQFCQNKLCPQKVIKIYELCCMFIIPGQMWTLFLAVWPYVSLNPLTSGCSVQQEVDYSCLFHWIMASAWIRDNLKMCGGWLVRKCYCI